LLKNGKLETERYKIFTLHKHDVGHLESQTIEKLGSK